MSTDSSPTGFQDQIDALAQRLAQGELDRRELHDLVSDLQAEGIVTEKRSREMEDALKSSRTIGAAIGIIMESRDLTEDQAFAVLKQASQDHNRKIREIAEDLVKATGRGPSQS